jgi:anti-sigma-K factor RskA
MPVLEHMSDWLPAYALDVLDEAEAQQVKEHLEACEICQAELRAYRGVVDELPLAALESQPPPTLKANILSQVAKPAGVQQPKPSWWQRFTFKSPAWGMVSLALIVLLGVSNLFLWRQINSLQDASQDTLATVPLTGGETTPDATGLLVISMDGEHGTLVVDRLPSLDESQQYQVWLIRDDQRTSGGVFSVDEDGYGAVWVHAPDPLISYERFGVTIEPAGGSPAPTGERVLGGQL